MALGMAMRSLFVMIVAVVLTSVMQAHSQTLDDQGRCAAQAKRAFQQWQEDDKKGPLANMGTTISSDYESHYNTKIKKCLILIEASTSMGNISNYATLMDAYERRVYASYLWISRQDKKYWEVPPIMCELISTHGEVRRCAHRIEFDAFVATYLEE
jgi:hypothetical protein